MINQFVTSNWYLFAALIAILGLLAFDPIRRRSSGIRPVSAIQLPQLMNHDNAVIVDVRDNTDFENSHIAKAIKIRDQLNEGNPPKNKRADIMDQYANPSNPLSHVSKSIARKKPRWSWSADLANRQRAAHRCCVKRTFPTSTPLMVE